MSEPTAQASLLSWNILVIGQAIVSEVPVEAFGFYTTEGGSDKGVSLS